MTAEELIESGKFVWDINRLILHPDFEAESETNSPVSTYFFTAMDLGLTS